MKIKYIGKPCASLTIGHIYEVISIEEGWLRIIDDDGTYPGEDLPGYLYPPELFEIVEE